MTRFAIIASLFIATLTSGCATTSNTSTKCKPGEAYSLALERCAPERFEEVPEYLTPPKFSSKMELPFRRLVTVPVLGHTSSAGTADDDIKKDTHRVWIAGGLNPTKTTTVAIKK